LEIDPDLLIPDRDRSLNDGAIIAMEWSNSKDQGGYYWQMLEAVADHYKIDLDVPVSQIPEEKLKLILYGTGKQEVTMNMVGRNDRKTTFETSFEGIIPNLERRFRETSSEYIRSKISEFMSDRPCPTCNGTRLRREALAVTVDGKKYR
jgi:excinuclease ABC subunit A